MGKIEKRARPCPYCHELVADVEARKVPGPDGAVDYCPHCARQIVFVLPFMPLGPWYWDKPYEDRQEG